MGKLRRKSDICPNCDQQLETEANYCSKCGQENHHHNISFSHLFLEILEMFFHFDTKIFKTIKYLVINPAKIINDFNAGKRASYIPPLRLYIFISVIFFAALALNEEINRKKNENKYEITDKKELDVDLPFIKYVIEENELKQIDIQNDSQVDSLLAAKNIKSNIFQRKFFRQLCKMNVSNDGNALLKKLLQSISFTFFIFMPFFAFLLLLLYVKQKIFYIQHVIFSIYLHSLAFFLSIIVLALKMLFHTWLLNLAFILFIPYLFFTMKLVYKQNYLITFVKFILLSCIYMIILYLGTSISLIVAILIY